MLIKYTGKYVNSYFIMKITLFDPFGILSLNIQPLDTSVAFWTGPRHHICSWT